MILTKLQSRLDDIAKNLADELDPVVERAAQMVATNAQNEAPAQSGRLRESIRPIKYDTCQYNVVADARAPSNNLMYGIMVEYGTEAGGRGGGNQAPNPFMARAAAMSLDEYHRMITERLGEL